VHKRAIYISCFFAVPFFAIGMETFGELQGLSPAVAPLS